jgi:putative MATE family efflux protein
MIGMSLQTIYMIADMVFVGRVGPDALTALAFNAPLFVLGLGVSFGLGTGVTSVIARSIGAGDKKAADNCAEHAMVLGLFMAAVVTMTGLRWGQGALAVLGVPTEIADQAWAYLRIMAGGFVFMMFSIFFGAILSGEGDMKTPVAIQGAGTILNIILDPVLIFGFDMGVRGAALATVISQALGCVVFAYMLFAKDHAYVTFNAKDFQFSGSILRSIVKVGLPASFSFFIMAFLGSLFNRILVTFSGEAVAAFQIGLRLNQLFVLPLMAIAGALVTLVGMFLGAGRTDLVRQVVRYAMSRSVAAAVLVGAIFYLTAGQMIGVFTRDPEILEVGTGMLHVVVFSYPFVAVAVLTGRILQGMGYGMPVMVISALRLLLIAGPLAWVSVFVLDKPLNWVWYALVIGSIGAAAVAAVWLRWAFEVIEANETLSAPAIG